MLSSLVPFACAFLLCGELVSCQAPDDKQDACLNTDTSSSPGLGLQGAYTDIQLPLIDSYWYQIVLDSSQGVWTEIQGNSENDGWRRGLTTLCRSTMVSTCNTGATENNWVATQFISRSTVGSPLYELPIIINITYRFLNCDCPRMFNVNYYPRNSSSESDRRVVANYLPVGTLSTATVTTTTSLTFNLSTQHSGFYIGFQDQNSCASVSRLQVYRVVCPQRSVGFAVYPVTPTAFGKVSVTAGCVTNGGLIAGKLECSPTGEWVGEASCGCLPGYQNTTSMTCEECGVGTFKSTTANTPCSVCPSNSVSMSTGAAECTCVTGYYRAPTDDRGDPCTTPPGSPPLSLATSIVSGTFVRLTWDPPTQSGNRSDLSYTVTYRIGNTTITINSPDTQITLMNLLPLMSYNVSVSAENGVSSQDIAGRVNRTAVIMITTVEPVVEISTYVYTVAAYLLAFALVLCLGVVVGLALNNCRLRNELKY